VPEPHRLSVNSRARWLLIPAAACLGLLLCEAIIRLAGVAPPVHAIWVEEDGSFYRRATNAVLNYELKPKLTRDFPTGRATSNSHGRRDRERTLAKPEGIRRILVLGDSVVEGISYVGDEDTISRQLESLYPEARTEFLNFGTSGYCTLAEVNLLRDRGLAFQPDLVLLMFVNNDFNNFNPEHTVTGGVIARPAWAKSLFIRSHLFRQSALQFNWYRFADEAQPQDRHHEAVGRNNVVDGLRLLRELADRHRFRVLVVAWPTFTDKFVGYRSPNGRRPLVIERLAAMNGLPIALIADSFLATIDNMKPRPNPKLHFTVRNDGIHPNPRGARIAARIIKPLIDGPLPMPPYLPGPDDDEAVRLAGDRGESRPVPSSFEQRSYQALLYQGRGADAAEYMLGVLARDPRNLGALTNLAYLQIEQGFSAESVPHLRQALNVNPYDTKVRTTLAFLLNAQSESADAATALRDGLAMMPNEPALHYALGAISITNSQLELAEQHLRAAHTLAPQLGGMPRLIRQLEAAKAAQKRPDQ
jgi:lysophospholipase L1-like esterase